VLLLSTASLAETPDAREAELSGARASFEQGMQAFEQGRFRGAVEHFKEADRLAPSPLLSFNIALAYERMRDGPGALAAYRDYLRRAPAAENAASTSIRISELELELQVSGVQQVSVLSTPPGATLSIDEVPRGMAPWTGELPPGPHVLTLRLRGYEDLVQSFELPARHSIDLTPRLRPVAHQPANAPLPRAAAERTRAAPAVRWWSWAAFGGSFAALLGSGAFELTRRGLEHDAEHEEFQLDARNKYDAMQSRKTTSRVLLATSVALGALGGVSLYLDLTRRERTEAALGLACEAEQCQALARGKW
jgi:tetratricopeptide (TPR) repeat protein